MRNAQAAFSSHAVKLSVVGLTVISLLILGAADEWRSRVVALEIAMLCVALAGIVEGRVPALRIGGMPSAVITSAATFSVIALLPLGIVGVIILHGLWFWLSVILSFCSGWVMIFGALRTTASP